MAASLIVSAAEANRSFSKLMRAVESGAEVTITSRGKPKVKMVSIESPENVQARMEEVLAAMEERWATTERVTIGPWTRDDLYDRDW